MGPHLIWAGRDLIVDHSPSQMRERKARNNSIEARQ